MLSGPEMTHPGNRTRRSTRRSMRIDLHVAFQAIVKKLKSAHHPRIMLALAHACTVHAIAPFFPVSCRRSVTRSAAPAVDAATLAPVPCHRRTA
jgi:hypothetical protein